MTDTPQEKPVFEIEATVAPQYSLALHQNSVPLLRELWVSNGGQVALDNLTLSLESSPRVFKPRTWRMAQLAAGERRRIPETDLGVELDADLLDRLTEAVSARVEFRLVHEDMEVASLTCSMRLLARDQWGGGAHVPEIIAAFVQPNDPAVDQVLKRATDILASHGKSSALDGYEQGKRQRAWEQAAAIWSAVCSLKLGYTLPPAGFETTGRRSVPPPIC